jgi:hypothetical protein
MCQGEWRAMVEGMRLMIDKTISSSGGSKAWNRVIFLLDESCVFFVVVFLIHTTWL